MSAQTGLALSLLGGAKPVCTDIRTTPYTTIATTTATNTTTTINNYNFPLVTDLNVIFL